MKRFFTTSITMLSVMAGAQAAYAQIPAMAQKEIAETESHVSKIDPIRNEADFRASIIGPGTMSLMASKMAVSKATNSKVKEFAMFETDEQTALGMILKELNTPQAAMTAKDAAAKKKLDMAAKGQAFDKAYIMGQIEGHETLLMLTESYLKNADLASTEPKEMEARHLAYFMKAAIKQHIANTSEIMHMLK